MKSQKVVTPAQAGVQGIPTYLESMNSGLRQNDATLRFATPYDIIIIALRSKQGRHQWLQQKHVPQSERAFDNHYTPQLGLWRQDAAAVRPPAAMFEAVIPAGVRR